MKSAELGALYHLVHQKANELSALQAISQEMVSRLGEGVEDEQLDALAPLLQARAKGQAAIDLLDKRMAFLADSGYEPKAAEAERLAMEQGTIRALLINIQGLDTQAMQTLAQAQAELMENMKDVRDWQKSLQAYAQPQDPEEGIQVDTLR